VNTNSGVTRSQGISENPKSRDFPDSALSLTRAQFTATTPQNYWEFVKASTPGGLRVKARELIGSVASAAALTGIFNVLNVGTFGNNAPLSPIIFARLATIGAAFEFYIFHKADLLFSSNQPTTAAGEILMCVDYDSKDNVPTTSIGMMRNITATMANVYSDASCQVLKSLARLPRFVVAQDNATDKDQLDQATIYVAAEGVVTVGAAALGYLIIEYDVEFFAPQ